MTENQTSENKETKNGRRFNKGYFFLAYVPFAIVMVVQTATTLPGLIIATYDISKSGQPSDLNMLMEIFNKKYALWGYIAYCIICIAIFTPWYIKGFVKKSPAVDYKKALGIKPLALSVGVMLCLCFAVSGVFTAIDIMFPEAMNAYKKLMEISSLGTDMSITIVYGILLGPVTEELCFRGLIFGMLEKSNARPLLFIFIQGLLFGIMHMNLEQGLYALALGMMLGYIRYRYKTVIITIIAHTVFNFVGTIGANFLARIGMNDTMEMVFGAVAIVAAAGLFVLILKDKGLYLKESEYSKALIGVKDD